jgi:hypothetical protein
MKTPTRAGVVDRLSISAMSTRRSWFFSQVAREAVSALLESAPCGRILHETELKALGVLFDDHRYGDLVFLLHPGWLISDSNFNGSGHFSLCLICK